MLSVRSMQQPLFFEFGQHAPRECWNMGLAAKEDTECILVVVVAGRVVGISPSTTFLAVNHK
jgi:hypothetical protein